MKTLFLIRSFNSLSESEDGPIMDVQVNPLFSAAMALKKQMSGDFNTVGSLSPEDTRECTLRAKRNWRTALRGLSERQDPWKDFHWEDLPVERALRHRYNALTKKWRQDDCVVKMETVSFGKGAMRECFRMKKLSNFSHSQDWQRDCNNYVAKRYMEEETERDTYFQDVRLQMDAKLWGEEYNRHNPPKKVDIFMMSILEFVDRPGRPLFHVEHFIDGEYIKYNSNSGFVDGTLCRQTPHAFSHFTFERSGHELIVVDIQGVGDLYTDPQIHTADGERCAPHWLAAARKEADETPTRLSRVVLQGENGRDGGAKASSHLVARPHFCLEQKSGRLSAPRNDLVKKAKESTMATILLSHMASKPSPCGGGVTYGLLARPFSRDATQFPARHASPPCGSLSPPAPCWPQSTRPAEQKSQSHSLSAVKSRPADVRLLSICCHALKIGEGSALCNSILSYSY